MFLNKNGSNSAIERNDGEFETVGSSMCLGARGADVVNLLLVRSFNFSETDLI
jgi:hypothetical protein